MAINLTKGQRVDIGLQKIGVGLGWDPNESASGDEFDLDASAFMLGSERQVPLDVVNIDGDKFPAFFVFYKNPKSPDGAVQSSGDDRTGGSSEGDDETLMLELGRVDPRIEEIVFTVTIYEFEERKQNVGQVRNSFIRIYDATTNVEICKYELGEDFSIETAVEFGRLYKRGGAWRFEAMGVGHKGGLATFVAKYAKKFS